MKEFGPKERPDYLDVLSKPADLAFNAIPEAVFKEHLLPLVREYRKGAKVSLAPWINVSGGPYNEIRITDVPGGKTVFVLPPPIVRLPTFTPKIDRRDGGFGALYLRYDELMKHGDQRQAHSLIQKGMREQMTEAATGTQVDYMLRWVAIYRRYQIPLAEMMGENGAALDDYLNRHAGKAVSVTSTPQDLTDAYDEF